jgi:DNA-binding NarL/FixJ family response regulator
MAPVYKLLLQQEGCESSMQPVAVRSQIHTLQNAIRDLSSGWTFVVCTTNQRLISTMALLLEQLEMSAGSIAELLALPLPQQDQILVICDDAGTDGGAEELMRQVRDRLGSARCRFLLCLEPEITQERLLRLWRCRPNAVSCGRNCGTGWLLQAVAAVLRGQFIADPTLQQRLYPPVPCCGLDERQLPITTRERELIHLVARGHDSPQIAALRQRRCDTIRRQLSVLYRKTGVRDQRGLISWALAHGVIRQVDLVPGSDTAALLGKE